jgi:hypothetical protein
MMKLKNTEKYILILQNKYSMKKSFRKKYKKIKTKTKKFVGGKSRILKIKGYYDKTPENVDKLIDYVIVSSKMNDTDKLNYLNKHTIYPQEISLLENFMDVDSNKVKKIAEHFFKYNPRNDDIDVDDKTIIIHDIEDNKRLQVAKQIIANINKSKTITLPTGPFRNNYEYYKKLIEYPNLDIFLKDVVDTDIGKDILLSPKIYKYIIEKYDKSKGTIDITTDLKLVNSELQKLKPI